VQLNVPKLTGFIADVKQNYQTPWSNSGDLRWDKGYNTVNLFTVPSFYVICAQTAHQLKISM
jgi:hypothetical protein